MRATLKSMARNAAAAQIASDLEVIAFSRSVGVVKGNADAELKTRVSDDDADAFRRLARDLGLTTSELLRDMVLVRIHGVERIASVRRRQLELAANGGPEKAHQS
jgi:hypothetical protein